MLKFSGKYSKTCVKRPLSKRQKIGFQDQLSLNAGQKYCRMLHGERSAILRSLFCLFLRGRFTQVLLYAKHLISSLPASCKFCLLLMIFANSLDPDQDRQNRPKRFDTLIVFLKDFLKS